ncbi:MAG: ATP-binding protein [Terracidiphilus sp.]|jgi:signal transduction histidine kinase
MAEPPIRRTSIAAKLTLMNILVSGIGLLLAFVSFLAYDLYIYRQSSVRSLEGLAAMVGQSSIDAIGKGDRAEGQLLLSAFNESSNVLSAAVYAADGSRFAEYSRADEQAPAPGATQFDEKLARTYWSKGIDIWVASRIEVHGKQIGTVYLHAQLRGSWKQTIRFAIITGVILLLCMLVALLVGVVFKSFLAQPIVSLANTALEVSRSRDYSLRFLPPQEYDELLSLTEAFNEMLVEIQRRDRALEQAKADLEARVEQRTEQLQAANRELEAFSYTVAHDLRSPLQAINNVAYLFDVTEKADASDERKAMLAQLRSSVTSMSNMIDDLLDLSRSTSVELHLAKLDLSPMVASILESLTKAYPERQVRAVVHPDCHVVADRGLMQIALQNLIRNAWKFTGRRENAEIEFGCMERPGASVIYLRDNGAGFDPKLAGRLFKPFQRLHRSDEFPGTGIGLATVRRIVGRHGGEVWAEGEIGKGATFYFTLEAHPEMK